MNSGMNAMPPFFAPGSRAGRVGTADDDGKDPVLRRMEERWFALHRAGLAVAGLAGDAGREIPPGVGDFPALIHRAGGWRLRLAEQGITDLAAIMEAGLSVLLSVRERGAETLPAAQALWWEFTAARGALLDLAKPLRNTMVERRKASGA